MKILGLDICKSSVAACLLTERPSYPREFFHDCTFYRFKADAQGIKELLALAPDMAVMEPTGVNYMRLWGTHLARSGVELRLVGHKQLKNHRENLGFTDKDDDTDALALACYGFDYINEPRRFVQIRDYAITRIRELVLRLAHLNRVQSPIINRARQDLAWQFPEVALVKSKRSQTSDVPLLWGWLAGERKSKKYDNLYTKSVGLGITDTVRYHAKRICDLQREEGTIELELRDLLSDPQFSEYLLVFAYFGFGERIRALLLSQIYPFENYLNVDGLPEVKIRKGRKSGKPTKRHLSLRRFQAALGVAPKEESSGDKQKHTIVGGSDLCRMGLWQWVNTRLEPQRSRMKNEVGLFLGDLIDEEKLNGRPVRLIRSRISAEAARLLFRALLNGTDSVAKYCREAPTRRAEEKAKAKERANKAKNTSSPRLD